MKIGGVLALKYFFEEQKVRGDRKSGILIIMSIDCTKTSETERKLKVKE